MSQTSDESERGKRHDETERYGSLSLSFRSLRYALSRHVPPFHSSSLLHPSPPVRERSDTSDGRRE